MLYILCIIVFFFINNGDVTNILVFDVNFETTIVIF